MPGLLQLEVINEASLAVSRAAAMHAQAAARIGLGSGRARAASKWFAFEPLLTVGLVGHLSSRPGQSRGTHARAEARLRAARTHKPPAREPLTRGFVSAGSQLS